MSRKRGVHHCSPVRDRALGGHTGNLHVAEITHDSPVVCVRGHLPAEAWLRQAQSSNAGRAPGAERVGRGRETSVRRRLGGNQKEQARLVAPPSSLDATELPRRKDAAAHGRRGASQMPEETSMCVCPGPTVEGCDVGSGAVQGQMERRGAEGGGA